jgi:6-phosphogluconolactonase (cycloisomerase 2 family)
VNAPQFAYVGCRTTKERKARGEGIDVYRVNPDTGGWSHVQLVPGLTNPSFLVVDRRREFLYSVHGDCSEISTFRIERQSGRLEFVHRQLTGGRNPVHPVIDESGRFMIVANYATGTLAVLPIASDGSLAEATQLAALPGAPGPHRVEQTSSHPHHCPFDPGGRFLLVPDKGLDRVFVLPFDAATGRIREAEIKIAESRPGSAPRHIAVSSNAEYAYVINELNSTITSYRYDARCGTLDAFQIVSSLPETYVGPNTGAEIATAPSGKFVYASNRGHDSIAIFSVEPGSGRLEAIGWEPSRGKGPRFFTLSPCGSFLYAANENSDTIVPFRIDAESGKLSCTGEIIQTGSPVCIVFG